MTRQDHLLIRAMEECAEVAQRLSKALVFGLGEVQPGHIDDNRTRVLQEYGDLVQVMRMAGFGVEDVPFSLFEEKRVKVEKYLAHSRKCGRLE